MSGAQPGLFRDPLPLPADLVYRPEFLSPAEEATLLEAVRALPFAEARYKEYEARRRIVSYGSRYDFSSLELRPAPGLPPFLLPLRERVGQALGLDRACFTHALVSEYRPGTALGWHRDVPDFELIAGISLATSCRMRFRPRAPRKGRLGPPPKAFEIVLEPRSLYVLQHRIRWDWQHSIAPAATLRYSITFRTPRRGVMAAP